MSPSGQELTVNTDSNRESCSGLCVLPGDLVLGDAEGVIAIPAAEVAALLPTALALSVMHGLI
ncbi:hypothetical protein [Pseudomonas donghuensis]|uniref:hypothetical protein n=1 Tax=Pseudomonas donghuensis TaxID=1163398 RepID=UPI0020C2F26E|nr:hypothetical protein [Pseudomonas donghuensis]MCP6699374.1 hypothetical protein [Pseudomonas donghuensis]